MGRCLAISKINPCLTLSGQATIINNKSPDCRKSLLRVLAEHCLDAKDKQELLHLSSRGGRQDYSSLISPVSPTLLDLLHRYPSCKPPLPALLDALPPLPPRLYSISSSPLEYPGSPHIALTVVEIGSPSPNVLTADGASPNSKKMNGNAPGKQTMLDRWGVASGQRRKSAILGPLGDANGNAVHSILKDASISCQMKLDQMLMTRNLKRAAALWKPSFVLDCCHFLNFQISIDSLTFPCLASGKGLRQAHQPYTILGNASLTCCLASIHHHFTFC